MDLPLLEAIARARSWSQGSIDGRVSGVGELARRERLTDRRGSAAAAARVPFTRIVEAIVEGRQPADLSTLAMTQRIELPPLWSAQQQALESR